MKIQPITRRRLLQLSGAGLLRAQQGVEVNDVHSQLNRTLVARIERPGTVQELRQAILRARAQGLAVCVSGSRHSMGGQQFATGGVLIDMRGLNRVLSFDPESRTVEMEAGIQWPELIPELARLQMGAERPLGIVQKQTGADWLSIGGALSSNVHGRGLQLKPIVDNVESFEIMGADGEIRRCDRSQNSELFRLAIGGYGLFGAIVKVRLRLLPRRKVRRVVEIRDLADIPEGFNRRIQDGYLYGDFQFATSSSRESFLHRGVFSCYQPVDPATPLTEKPTRFNPEDWARLTYYSHKNKRLAFEVYTRRYLATSGQIYWADSQLSGAYVANYHEELDRKLHARMKATEMITEIYVPRGQLIRFMDDARVLLRQEKANVIYGTVRLIERDDESFLRWAKESWACIIFNLHVTHSPQGLEAAARAFRGLISLGSSYYLTYHRYAGREQVERCYPEFPAFLQQKLRYDPGEVFQSDWYLHYKGLFPAPKIS
jgi:FAD/FMN-containing dehydrogenase